MFSKLATTSMPKVVNLRSISRNLSVSFDGYGKHLFKGAVAAPYLQKVGLPANTLDSNAWTTNGNADKVSHMCAILIVLNENTAVVYSYAISIF
jgi:hypothetical protein